MVWPRPILTIPGCRLSLPLPVARKHTHQKYHPYNLGDFVVLASTAILWSSSKTTQQHGGAQTQMPLGEAFSLSLPLPTGFHICTIVVIPMSQLCNTMVNIHG